MKLPAYIVVLILFVSCTHTGQTSDRGAASGSDSIQSPVSGTMSDSTAMALAALNFLHWYKENIIRLSRINLVDQEPGKNYSVNMDSCDRYLSELRAADIFTSEYLSEKRKEFERDKKELEANPQNEGPPYGFEADQVMLVQDIDSELDSIPRFKVVSASIANDTGTVDFTLYYEYEFMLLKDDEKWKVNRILLVGDE